MPTLMACAQKNRNNTQVSLLMVVNNREHTWNIYVSISVDK